MGNDEAPEASVCRRPPMRLVAHVVRDPVGEFASLRERAPGQGEHERVGAHAEGPVVARQAALDAPRDTLRTSCSLP